MSHLEPDNSEILTFDPVELPSMYAKAIVAILTAVLTVLAAALTDGVVVLDERLGIGLALVNAMAVYLVPNLPSGVGRYAKAIVAVFGTALQAAIPLIVNGTLPASSWLMVLIAALGALSVGIVPNRVLELAPVRTLTND
jgi:hypothetical protein